jgi:hypothetical protein
MRHTKRFSYFSLICLGISVSNLVHGQAAPPPPGLPTALSSSSSSAAATPGAPQTGTWTSAEPTPAAAATSAGAGVLSTRRVRFRDAAAKAPSLSFDSSMPIDLQQQLYELEQWAIANKKDARIDAIAFWIFKIPAILGSTGAGLFAHFHWPTVSLISGAVASAFVIIDGVHPRGMLRNIHHRAYSDIRILSTSMVTQWRIRSSSIGDDDTARQIMRDAEKERKQIAQYVRDAEIAHKSKI